MQAKIAEAKQQTDAQKQAIFDEAKKKEAEMKVQEEQKAQANP